MAQLFEIGLVMAGAVSAGAYTAGVIDFLIQALDEWQQAKDAGTGVPPHAVRLKVMAGTSAGGMTAAIAAGALLSRFHPLTDPDQPDPNNKLYDSWVRRIDIDHLLGCRDLDDPKASVRSLLDATVLEDIARNALDLPVTPQPRVYLANPLHLVLTFTNLRGVPYNIGFRSGEPRAWHEMYAHADWLHFALANAGDVCPPGALFLDWQRSMSGNWELLKSAALATGAFPIGLAPRSLNYRRTLYDGRQWCVPQQGERVEYGCRYVFRRQPIPPHWPDEPAGQDHYTCLAVDGGVMNNEPFDLARRILLEDDCASPREANAARRAIILIDPFPGADHDVRHEPGEDDVVSVLLRLFAAMKNQARFKPEELTLAQDRSVHSRFLIAPSRGGADYPICCGALGGFSGFLAESFRAHDFMLGRKNCWSFLKNHFRLSHANPLFADWSPELKQQWGDAEGNLPVIPLLGSAADEPRVPPWPRYEQQQLEALMRRIEARYDAVTTRLGEQLARDNFLARMALRFFLWRKRDDFARLVRRRIEMELREYGLLK